MDRRVPQVAPATLRKLQVRGYPVMFVDLRSADDFHLEHIPGAFHCPLLELPQLQSNLPMDRLLVLYTLEAKDAALAPLLQTLNRSGFHKVYLLVGGLTAWKNAGYPVDSGPANGSTLHLPESSEGRAHYPWVPSP